MFQGQKTYTGNKDVLLAASSSIQCKDEPSEQTVPLIAFPRTQYSQTPSHRSTIIKHKAVHIMHPMASNHQLPCHQKLTLHTRPLPGPQNLLLHLPTQVPHIPLLPPQLPREQSQTRRLQALQHGNQRHLPCHLFARIGRPGT